MGFSIPGYFAFTEMYGFKESSVGTCFLRKSPYSGISCCLELGQCPVSYPGRDAIQTAEQGVLGEGTAHALFQ